MPEQAELRLFRQNKEEGSLPTWQLLRPSEHENLLKTTTNMILLVACHLRKPDAFLQHRRL
jgi:hypothetical protein